MQAGFSNWGGQAVILLVAYIGLLAGFG